MFGSQMQQKCGSLLRSLRITLLVTWLCLCSWRMARWGSKKKINPHRDTQNRTQMVIGLGCSQCAKRILLLHKCWQQSLVKLHAMMSSRQFGCWIICADCQAKQTPFFIIICVCASYFISELPQSVCFKKFSCSTAATWRHHVEFGLAHRVWK